MSLKVTHRYSGADRVCFISDLHLDPQRPHISAAFVDFLIKQTDALSALYILGDLFEVWLGDDDDNPHYRDIISQLARRTAQGLPIYVMHGNRDFLIGRDFAAQSGCELIPDPLLIDLFGTHTLLLHGDTLCTDDLEYQAFRHKVRNPDWQMEFLRRPLAQRRQTVQGLREESRQKTRSKSAQIMDVNAEAVADCLRHHAVWHMIHGHTHRPAIHTFELNGHAAQRIVLGDWYDQGSLLHVDAMGQDLTTLPANR